MKLFRFLILAAAPVVAGTVEFSYAGLLTCAGDRIDVGGYAAPMMVDWDGDGRQDLICGQFDWGRIRFYPNVGTAGCPEFVEFHYLLDGAEYLSVPYG